MTTTAVRPRTVRPLKVAMASFIGTAIEWYDYFIYGSAAALVFGPLFFPEFSEVAGTMAAFATFSVGFLARPLGGIVMGHFGDRVGRKSMLVISLILMGLATVGIGLLPTYATIGVWAPILLVTLRFIQGIGVGGEWGGAVLMAVEHAPANRKTFYGSFPQMGTPGGLILANLAFLGVITALDEQAFLDWGWRVPFLASSVLVIVGIVIRFSLTESPDFQRVEDSGTKEKMPILAVIRRNPKQLLLVSGALAGNAAFGYIFMAYLLSYATKSLGLSRPLILTLILIGTALWLVSTPIAGAMCDTYGTRKVLLFSSVALTGWAVVFFPLVDTANTALVLIALLGAGLLAGATYGPMAALFSELFSAEVRYSGVSLGYQTGAILGGGLAPTVATALYATTNSSTLITVYLGGMTAVMLACLTVLTRTHADKTR